MGGKRHELLVEFTSRCAVGNRPVMLQQDRSSIHNAIQQKRRDAGFSITVDDGVVDGCSTAVPRQQRGMDVEGPYAGKAVDSLGKDAKGNHAEYIGPKLAQLPNEVRILERHGLEDGGDA